MIKQISIPLDQITLPQRLLNICKKPQPNSDDKIDIDFLLLEREMEQLQTVQSKTCQQVVEFVDEHLEQFIAINNKFQQVHDQIENSEMLIKKILPKIDVYKAQLQNPQTKMQQFATNYEKYLMQQQLSQIAKQQAQFLLEFIEQFEKLINQNVQQLTHRQKYYIVRLLRKKDYIKCIFQHPFLNNVSQQNSTLINLLENISEQLQFYLSEQLTRVAVSPELRKIQNNAINILQQIKIWHQSIGKLQSFYETIEEQFVGKELSALQSVLVSNKQQLMVGKQPQIIKQVFANLFRLISQFPQDYPTERTTMIIRKFLSKKQLNFMYSYIVPAFPVSYSAYKEALHLIKNKSLRNQLETKHGWNLKFWADLRIKSILDRSSSSKQKQNYLNLNKWVQIVFKKSFMIEGVKSYMIKLAFLLTNKFCTKIQEDVQFSSANLNQIHSQLVLVKETLSSKLVESFSQELNDQQQIKVQIVKNSIQNIIKNIISSIETTLKKWIQTNMQMIINTCKSSLQPCKSFVMKIVSKKDKKKQIQNNQANIMKPLESYFKNNPEISQSCQKFVHQFVLQIVQEHYDSEYAKQIFNYCNSNISTEQIKTVMEIVSLERNSIFEAQQNIKQK